MSEEKPRYFRRWFLLVGVLAAAVLAGGAIDRYQKKAKHCVLCGSERRGIR